MFSAVPDGPHDLSRLVMLTIVPSSGAVSEAKLESASDVLRLWEGGIGGGDILGLRGTLADPRFCALFPMPNPQVAADRDYFITLLHGMKKSSLSIAHRAAAGRVATVIGSWEVDSSFMGPRRLGTTATLINDCGRWKLQTLSVGPQSLPARQ